MSLNLYTYIPSPNVICNDDIDSTKNFFIQGIIEALNDDSKSKFAILLEMKREQSVLLKRLKHDLLHHNNGNYYKNHILLDILSLFSVYCDEFDNIESAFDIDLKVLCQEIVCTLFELFNCVTDITVYLKADLNDDNVIVILLHELQALELVTLIKTVSLN
ncbi:unknown [Choristoneura occidentalis granulovirus]|uniref:P18 n=1 Tax=Choristoneura occidentalis granulovirus TaxID=364745 RepID=Q1A4M3_9BBAC|nr:unknown [Choristoneura fumiferana granulovirus]ABC61207.1 unknown [Choristoneura fumiferana granulovirus]